MEDSGKARVNTLLSNISPPSALPANLVLSPPSGQETTTTTVPPPQNVQASAEPHISPEFSPAIPPNKNTSAEDTVATPEGQESKLGSLNSEPLATALGPITQSGSSLFGWMKGAASSGSEILSKVAEKAKNSVDNIVTTLDPQMKEYIYSGGDIEIIVASDRDDEVRSCREAFQTVFGKATVIGLQASRNNIAAQPVGFEAALRGAQERTADLRTRVEDKVPVLAIENFIIEAFPDQWFDVGIALLTDPLRNIMLKSMSQMTPIPLAVVATIRESTPKDYQFQDTGFSSTVEQVMSDNLKVSSSEWHQFYTSVNRKDMILNTVKSLATLYKTTIASGNA